MPDAKAEKPEAFLLTEKSGLPGDPVKMDSVQLTVDARDLAILLKSTVPS